MAIKLQDAPMDQLVAAFIKLRDAKSEAKAAAEKVEADFKEKMDKIAAVILGRFKETGVMSARTENGTAFIEASVSATVGDRDAFREWILEDPDERFVFVDMRANKTSVVAYRNDKDDLPPGINWREETTIKVRRS